MYIKCDPNKYINTFLPRPFPSGNAKALNHQKCSSSSSFSSPSCLCQNENPTIILLGQNYDKVIEESWLCYGQVMAKSRPSMGKSLPSHSLKLKPRLCPI